MNKAERPRARRASGKFGIYFKTALAQNKICFNARNQLGVDIESDFLFIPADQLGQFVTELITMARELGVTGQEKGNE